MSDIFFLYFVGLDDLTYLDDPACSDKRHNLDVVFWLNLPETDHNKLILLFSGKMISLR